MSPLKITDKYDDIINLPHHKSEKHGQMSMINRAAQFSPFAALTGHDAAVKETARLTDSRIEIDETVKAEIDVRLQLIQDNIKAEPIVSLTYFEPDIRKAGGAYLTITDKIKKIDHYENNIITHGEQIIPINEIIAITGELFENRGEI